MRGIQLYGIIAAAFMAGAFLASPELRAYAANTVFSTDIVDGEVKTADIGGGAVTNAKLANGAVNSAKIADNSITAADIAPNAVGASELIGVSKLIFGECTIVSNTQLLPLGTHSSGCALPGAQPGDNAIVTRGVSNTGNDCFVATAALVFSSDNITIRIKNFCTTNQAPGTLTFSVIVYNT